MSFILNLIKKALNVFTRKKNSMLPYRLKSYMKEIKASLVDLDESIESVFAEMYATHLNKKRIWILGNGGSLAIAQHFAQDLLKLCGVRAEALNCPSIITAYANDDQFEYSYFNPLNKLSDEGDLIFIFSCSGKSRNYIEFVSGFADSGKKNRIVSVIGTDGGFLKDKSDACVHIKSDDYQVCESAFCIVSDILIKSLMEV